MPMIKDGLEASEARRTEPLHGTDRYDDEVQAGGRLFFLGSYALHILRRRARARAWYGLNGQLFPKVGLEDARRFKNCDETRTSKATGVLVDGLVQKRRAVIA